MGDVSIRPDQAAEGGGLIDDFDATIVDLRFGLSPDGYMKGQKPITLCIGKFLTDDGDEHTELFTIGGKNDFYADDTGRGLNKSGSKSVLTKNCKYILFADSLIESGFPLNRMEVSDCSSIIDTKGHFLRKTVDYKDLKKKKDDDRESTVLLCTKILQLPWDAPKGKAGKGKSADKFEVGLIDTVAGIVQGVIIDNAGEVAKKGMLSALFKHADIKAMNKATKTAALKLANDDTYLKDREEWVFEDGVLKMG